MQTDFADTLTYQNEPEPRERHTLKDGVKNVPPGYLPTRLSVFAVGNESSIRCITGIQNRYWNMPYYCMRR